MYIDFDNRIINSKAISEVYRACVNCEEKIIALRLDGSYMASESFSSTSEANKRFNEIKEKLIHE